LRPLLVIILCLVFAASAYGANINATDTKQGVSFHLEGRQLTVRLLPYAKAAKEIEDQRLQFICGKNTSKVDIYSVTDSTWFSGKQQKTVYFSASPPAQYCQISLLATSQVIASVRFR